MNLAQFAFRNALRHPEDPALSLGETVVATHRRLARQVLALSHHLTGARGLVGGDRVAMAMTNAPDFWVALLACWHAGVVAVPLNPKLHPREVDQILGQSGASLCFATPDLAEGVAGTATMRALADGVVETGRPAFARLLEAEAPEGPPTPLSPDAAAWMFHTSGTTGRPKGAVLTHRNLLAMVLSYFADLGPIAPTDAILHAAPQSHGSGLWGLVHLAKGANSVTPESHGFDPAEIAALLSRWRGLSLFAAPTMVNRLVASAEIARAPLANLGTITYGGAPMYRADLERALDLFGPRLAQIYGQGEAPMTITALSREDHWGGDPEDREARLRSVGYARTGVDVAVLDPAGRPLPPGEAGEVAARGDVVMAGYWNDPEATARTLGDGWLRTGDVGRMDDRGRLTLTDRSKDVIISGGSNIYPREVEEALAFHPQVAEVCVVGAPDPEWGEAVVAFIVPRAGAPLEEATLADCCRSRIASFKKPRRYVFVEALPKNATGKILKTELRRRIEPGPAPVVDRRR
jgi:long-chain acyl-CoA synthetase